MSGQGQIKENIDPAFVINDGTDSGYILVKHILVNSTSEEVLLVTMVSFKCVCTGRERM